VQESSLSPFKTVQMLTFHVMSRAVIAFLLLILAVTTGCEHQTTAPSLTETTDWMRQSLAAHNGQQLDSATFAPEVKVLAKLTADKCSLDYAVTNYESLHFELGAINPSTIKLEKINKSLWVVFKTTNYARSIRYIHTFEPNLDYTEEFGGFSLDSEEHAQSFLKALHRAVDLCGGKPSTF
jgi:hypothetical protein